MKKKTERERVFAYGFKFAKKLPKSASAVSMRLRKPPFLLDF
jgi:hypothetical protein